MGKSAYFSINSMMRFEVAGLGLDQGKSAALNPGEQVPARWQTLLEHVHGLRNDGHGRHQRGSRLADKFQSAMVVVVVVRMSVSNAFIDAYRHRVLGRPLHRFHAKWGRRDIFRKAGSNRSAIANSKAERASLRVEAVTRTSGAPTSLASN
jgi:hypothetical protein